MPPYLIDTNILIHYLRGKTEAINFLENAEMPLYISSINVAELYAGVREGDEKTLLKNFVAAFDIVFVNGEIAKRAGLFKRDYAKTHGVGLADALIAASAEFVQATLVTQNVKHFPMLSRIIAPF